MIKSKQNVLLILACLFIRTNWSWVCLFKVALLTSFSLVMLYYKTKKTSNKELLVLVGVAGFEPATFTLLA